MHRKPFLIIAAAALLMLLAAACGGGNSSSSTATFNGTPGGEQSTAKGSPLDATLALVRDQRLLVRDTNGQERLLYRSPANTFPTFPVWSPDGARIAFAVTTAFTGQPDVDWGSDVYIVNASGGEPTLVWKHDQSGVQAQGLAWMPDGKSLLMGYQATIIKDNKYQGQTLRVDKLDPSSGAVTPVVTGGYFPSISRDGTHLAYMTMDDTGQGGLWVSAIDGSGAKQLVQLSDKFLAILAPRISPDGSAIAFAAATPPSTAAPAPKPSGGSALAALLRPFRPRAAEAHGLPMDIWKVMTADGTVTRLTKINEDEPYPSWYSDGSKIVIFATGGLYVMNADGSGLKKIAPGSFGGQEDVKPA